MGIFGMLRRDDTAKSTARDAMREARSEKAEARDRKSTRLNSSHLNESRMPSSA